MIKIGLGDLLHDKIHEIKETYLEYYKELYEDVDNKKLDIILNVMDTLSKEDDIPPWVYVVMSKEDNNKIEQLYQEINKKANKIQELFKKTVKDCRDNYEWNTELKKYVKK